MLTKNFETLKTEVSWHIAADAVIAGDYWNEADNAVGGQGCFIGCLAHSDRAEDVVSRFGLPMPLVRLCENIFESLPPDEGKAFFASLPEAVGSDGKDLSMVHWAFLALELRALPSVKPCIQAAIDPVIAGMDLLSGGNPWPNADYYAAHAAYAASYAAAYAAYAASYAYYAADAAYYAADAAANYDTARIRQRDTLLKLISETPSAN